MVTGDAHADGGRMPKKCLQTDESGTPATCTQQPDGSWEVSFPQQSAPGAGMPGAMVALFVLALLGGLAVTVWKVTTARRMARDSGMNQADATTMTLLTDDGFEATYLAANLRHPQPAEPAPPADRGAEPEAEPEDAASRLRELQGLLDQGLITEEEYAAARRTILGSL